MLRRLLATLVITSTSAGCGSAPPSVLEASLAPTPAVRASLQDQRIQLEPIVVAAIADPMQNEPSASGDSEAVAALHNRSELALRAQQGVGDLRACMNQYPPDLTEGARDLVLNLEIDETGRVLGGVTNPGGGEAGLPALADCLLLKARSWTFPKRTTPGSTVLIVPYQVVFDSAPK